MRIRIELDVSIEFVDAESGSGLTEEAEDTVFGQLSWLPPEIGTIRIMPIKEGE